MKSRIVASVVLLLTLLLAPWQLFFVAALVFSLWIPKYYEALVGAVVFDLLYRPDLSYFEPSWSMTLVFVIIFFVVEILRPRVRFIAP